MQQPPVLMVQPKQAIAVGPNSMRLQCPNCLEIIKTRVNHNSTSRTHFMALCLFLFCCWPCVCCPYCCDSCRNADHYCPNCETFLGTYES